MSTEYTARRWLPRAARRATLLADLAVWLKDSAPAQPMTGPRVPMRPSSYLEREDFIAHAIKNEENK